MKKGISAWLLMTSLSAAMLFLAACTSPNNAGEEVLPDEDLIQGVFVDTFSIEFRTITVDSVLTDELSRDMFGNYVDEEFGWIFAESYLQTRLSGSNLVFADDPAYLSLDSIVLRIDLTGFYGRYNDPMTIEVFEITSDFPTDSTLTSVYEMDFDSSYDYANGYTIDFSNLSGFTPWIDIPLDDSLGRKLLFADSDSLANNATFTSFFNGLMIRSKPVSQAWSREPGGIFYFDPESDDTRLTLHYKDTTGAKSVVFDINSNSSRYHRIYRSDYQSRLLKQMVDDSGDPAAMYGGIQAGALTKLYVGVPSMTGIDPAGINRADLILKVDESFMGSDDRFDPPDQIFLFIADSTKEGEYDPSSITSQASYDPNSKAYTIVLTNTLQQILAGRLPDNGFILLPGQNGVTLNRAVFGGPGHPTLSPKLRVIYTTVPG